LLPLDEYCVKLFQSLARIAVGLNAMTMRLGISWLLVSSLCLPLLSRAQSSNPRYVVSVRELSIPPKALHAFQTGVERLAKDDAAGSLPYLQRAVAEFATYYEAYFEIGMADLKLSRTAEAEQALRKSIELSAGRYAEPMFALGAALTSEEKFSEGEGVIRQALNLDPTSWAGHYCLGWALFNLTRLQEAEKSVREALRWKPDSPEAYLLLADIHHRQKDYPALLKDLDEYLKLEPNSPIIAKLRALRHEAERAIVESRSASALVQPQP
jgi:tetratricopeptide (TPR) repeat protein